VEHAQQILSLLGSVDDPLLASLRIAADAADGGRQSQLLIDATGRYGKQCGLSAIREMSRIVSRLVRRYPDDARQVLTRLATPGDGIAQGWSRAMLLEAFGSAPEALAIYALLPDPDAGEGRAARLLACARTMLAGGDRTPAARSLREAIQCASGFHTMRDAAKLLDRLDCTFARKRAKIALVGTTTLDLYAPVLRALAFAGGIWADVFVGGFNQYRQEILDPRSKLAAFAPDAIIVAAHWQALGLPDEDPSPESTASDTISTFASLWQHCRDRLRAFVLQHNFEVPNVEPYGRLSWSLPGGRSRLLQRINVGLWDAIEHESDVAVVDVDQVAGYYGKASWHDPALWHTARQYPTVDAIPALLRQDVAVLKSLWGLNAKCLVLDLDGTLWGGVIGEDGLGGIELGGTGSGEAYADFQRYLRSLQHRGVVLAVCSKNNPDDALQVFRAHPEMVLTEADIALFEIGWLPKDEGLRRVAATLNIGLDSIVFVDDSPQERAWVRQRLPEVMVPEMPTDPARYAAALADGLYFESLRVTDEDKQRTRTYQSNAERAKLETSSASIDGFLESLHMSVDLRPFEEIDLPRIVQLINKTNQFNLTSKRRSESEIRELMRCPHVYSQSMRLADRFGDNGLTGVMIGIEEHGAFHIDTWLLSCRVMGRRVEEVMLHSLVRRARERQVSAVVGDCILTAKNAPVHDLYDRLGFERSEQRVNGDRTYRWSLAKEEWELPSFFAIRDFTQRGSHVAKDC